MHRRINAAAARFARFDFDPGASQEGRQVKPASEEYHFGRRLSGIGLESKRDGDGPGLADWSGPRNGGWFDERDWVIGREH